MLFLHGIEVPFTCALLSNSGQYLEDFGLNSKWIHNFWQLIYDEIGRTSNYWAFQSLFWSIIFEVFSRFLLTAEVDFWCIHAWGKQTREMDKTSSKPDRSLMWYQYFGICQLFLQYCTIGYPLIVPLHLSWLIHWSNNRSMVGHYYAAHPWCDAYNCKK